MLLNKEQAHRYARHVIIPEISEQGQKKLLDATVGVQSESAEAAAPLLYYLTAAGIGNIECEFADRRGSEVLCNNLKDLSSDVSITFEKQASGQTAPEGRDCAIILGSADWAVPNRAGCKTEGYPVIAAFNRNWQGYIQVIGKYEQRDDLPVNIPDWTGENIARDRTGSMLACCLLGALAAIEAVKLLLGVGTPAYNPLSFDLLSMSFDKQENSNPGASRFFNPPGGTGGFDSAPLDVHGNGPGNRLNLAEAKVLVVGTGGLGSPVAYALTRAGTGTIGLLDYDTVDISNLNRQILHSASRLGLPKVESAAVFLRRLNPNVNLIKHNTAFKADNALKIINEYDVIIDGVDNFPARYLLNDACFFARKPLIEAGVAAFDGMGMTIIPGRSMCYRCLFPRLPGPDTIPSCSETGVLGPVPGVMGFIEACEAVKLLSGQGRLLTDTLLTFDALDLNFELFHNEKNPACPLCGSNPVIKGIKL